MENTRVYFFVLLLLVGAIAGVNIWDHFTNVEPKWNYILKAVDSLEAAQETPDLERKHLQIQEAIRLYGEGPNSEWLQMLSQQNSAMEVDYFLPEAIDTLEDERTAAINSIIFSLRGLVYMASTILLVAATVTGTFSNRSYNDWNTNERHVHIALIAVCFAVFVVVQL